MPLLRRPVRQIVPVRSDRGTVRHERTACVPCVSRAEADVVDVLTQARNVWPYDDARRCCCRRAPGTSRRRLRCRRGSRCRGRLVTNMVRTHAAAPWQPTPGSARRRASVLASTGWARRQRASPDIPSSTLASGTIAHRRRPPRRRRRKSSHVVHVERLDAPVRALHAERTSNMLVSGHRNRRIPQAYVGATESARGASF